MAFLTDGHRTLFIFTATGIGNTILRERDVTPPGIDGGGEVDTTVMRNFRWRTKQPKHLITAESIKASCQYDPVIYAVLVSSVINVNQRIQIQFPDGSNVDFWGWLNKVSPPMHREGEFPLCDVEIIISNQDNAGNEVAPFYFTLA